MPSTWRSSTSLPSVSSLPLGEPKIPRESVPPTRLWVEGEMLQPPVRKGPLPMGGRPTPLRCDLPNVCAVPPRASNPLLHSLLRAEILPASVLAKDRVPKIPSLLSPLCRRVWSSLPAMLPSLLPLPPLPTLEQVLQQVFRSATGVRTAVCSAVSLAVEWSACGWIVFVCFFLGFRVFWRLCAECAFFLFCFGVCQYFHVVFLGNCSNFIFQAQRKLFSTKGLSKFLRE